MKCMGIEGGGRDIWLVMTVEEKNLRIAVDCKLNMSHQRNMTVRKANEVLDCINIIIYKSQEVIVRTLFWSRPISITISSFGGHTTRRIQRNWNNLRDCSRMNPQQE
uniref:Uncharacterized protein n=1 Tax=Micrurus corallinus TaxID=54390 RepID=A0A2D4EZ57_MICCO